MALFGIRFGASLDAAIVKLRFNGETAPPPSTQSHHCKKARSLARGAKEKHVALVPKSLVRTWIALRSYKANSSLNYFSQRAAYPRRGVAHLESPMGRGRATVLCVGR